MTPSPDTAAPPSTLEQRGLVCRECGCRHFLTVYTRPQEDCIIRRKRCRNCGRAIATREKML